MTRLLSTLLLAATLGSGSVSAHAAGSRGAAPKPARGAQAEVEAALHVVQPGEVLSRIAERYGLSTAQLRGANQLRDKDLIPVGKALRLPFETHTVERGETLSHVALEHHATIKELRELNRLRRGRPLSIGQKLLVPIAEEAEAPAQPSKVDTEMAQAEAARVAPPDAATPAHPMAEDATPAKRASPDSASAVAAPGSRCLRTPKPLSWCAYSKPAWRRGYVELGGHGKSWKGYVIGPDDQVLPAARIAISRALASWRTGKSIVVDEELVRLIARISDEFGGRKLRIVSGYREHSHARNSRHKLGKALDFSIPGVPNVAVRDYLRSLGKTGVGYYPNSTHVHVDVREGSGYWVDYSRPGQRPRYWRPAGGQPVKAPGIVAQASTAAERL